MSQSVLGKSARAVPHVEGSGLELVISVGIEERGKNQTRIPASLSSAAKTYNIVRLVAIQDERIVTFNVHHHRWR